MKLISHHYNLRPTKELIAVRLISRFAFSGTLLLIPIFFSLSGVGDSATSIINTLIVLIVFIFSLFASLILEKFDEYKILFVSYLLIILSLLVITFNDNIIVFSIIITLIAISRRIEVDVSAVLFKDTCDNKDYVKKRSLLQISENLGWTIGPIFMGFVLNGFGEKTLLLTSVIFLFVVILILFIIPITPKTKVRIKKDQNVRKNILSFIKNKELKRAYLLSFSIGFWWVVQWFFIPYLMIQNGYLPLHVGLYMGFLGLPLITVQYFIPKLFKKFGMRKILLFTYTLLSIIAGTLFIFKDQFFIILVLFIIANIALAFLEVLPEVHFFKSLKSSTDEEKFISIHSSSLGIADILGKGLIAILFIFLPFEYIFILLLLLSLYMLKNSFHPISNN